MIKQLLIFLFLLPFSGFAQYTITGTVISTSDKKPIANASVFLNNAVVGTKSDDNGSYTLTGVRPGQYDLVVSVVGFETYHQNIMVNSNIKLAGIEISPKTILLQEVRIKPNNNWARDYELFKRYFFGPSAYAKDCKILNPDLLDLDYNSSTRVLTARSNDFLEIENKALGYKIRYLLSDFKNDTVTSISYYEGTASFQELDGSSAQKRKWAKNRLNAYEGSSVHFLRSLINNTYELEGFKVFRLIRKPNPSYDGFNNKYIQNLVNTPLTANEFASLTDVKGEFALGFKDCLYILYNKKRAHLKPDPNLLISPDYLDDPLATTVIFNDPHAFFDYNGIIMNPRSVIFDGNWATRLIAELLPVDYVPTATTK
ncbi:carboxypeptidase-like regulatory domain-containing protein [Mucilaginibacter sp.]|uniref:carboxypeptidase-like regulatory domain-containing protein n=1 Tax=Mucilaginibacter sp. TaxID=1882438 RepID=UPI003D134209